MAQNALPRYSFPKISLRRNKSKKNVETTKNNFQRSKFNVGERRMIGTFVLVLFLLIGLNIFLSNQVTGANESINSIQSKIQQINAQNDSSRDKINKATTPDQLDKLAKEYNMSATNGSVQNINR